MTKCCSSNNDFQTGYGGGVYLQTLGVGSVTVVLSHLILSQNSAEIIGGNLAVILYGHGRVTLTISNCLITKSGGGGEMYFEVGNGQSSITIQNTDLVENVINDHGPSELSYRSPNSARGSLSLINSTIVHTETHSDYGVRITGCCPIVIITNTRISIKQNDYGFYIKGTQIKRYNSRFEMNNCQFEGGQSVGAILYLRLKKYCHQKLHILKQHRRSLCHCS